MRRSLHAAVSVCPARAGPGAIEVVMRVNALYATRGIDRLKASPVRVCFIRRHFANREGVGPSRDKPCELRCIRRFCGRDLHASHGVRCAPPNQVGLHPCGFAPHLPPYRVKLPVIGGFGEAGGIYREVCLHSSQREGTLLRVRLGNAAPSGGRKTLFFASLRCKPYPIVVTNSVGLVALTYQYYRSILIGKTTRKNVWSLQMVSPLVTLCLQAIVAGVGTNGRQGTRAGVQRSAQSARVPIGTSRRGHHARQSSD